MNILKNLIEFVSVIGLCFLFVLIIGLIVIHFGKKRLIAEIAIEDKRREELLKKITEKVERVAFIGSEKEFYGLIEADKNNIYDKNRAFFHVNNDLSCKNMLFDLCIMTEDVKIKREWFIEYPDIDIEKFYVKNIIEFPTV